MTETDPLGLAKHVLEVRLEKDHSKSRLASGSTAILSALIAVHEAVERNTATLEAAHGKTATIETSINYGTVVNDVEKLREQAKSVASYGGRKITGTKTGDEGVAMTTDTPFWTAPLVKPAMDVSSTWTRPTVVADKDGDKPIESADTADIPQAAKVSPVTVTEGADVSTPPRITRDTGETFSPGYQKLADGDTARNIIIGTSVGDVTLFKTHNRRYAMWHTVYPGVEDRLKDVVVGEWIATPDSVSDPQTLAMVSLVDAVKARQTRRKADTYGFTSPFVTDPDRPWVAWRKGDALYDRAKASAEPARKPSTDIETTAAQLNAQHLGRRITVHNDSGNLHGELTAIEYTSGRFGNAHSVELNDAGTMTYLDADAKVTVHTDYPDIAIGDEA